MWRRTPKFSCSVVRIRGECRIIRLGTSATSLRALVDEMAERFFHRAYYADCLKTDLLAGGPTPWERVVLCATSRGLGAELLAAEYLRDAAADGGVLLVAAASSTSFTELGARLADAFAAAPRDATDELAVVAFSDGSTPEQRSKAYAANNVVVAHARTFVTDVLTKRLAVQAVCALLIWDASVASEGTAFLVGLLRDFDSALRRAPLQSRSVLALSDRMGDLRGDAIATLKPTSIRVLPYFFYGLKQWRKTEPATMAAVDTIQPDRRTQQCAASLLELLRDMTGELRAHESMVAAALSAVTDGELASVPLGSEPAQKTHRPKAQPRERQPPNVAVEALLSGQLDALLRRLSDSAAVGVRDCAKSLQQLLRLQKLLTQGTPLQMLRLLDTFISGKGQHRMPQWTLAARASEFIEAVVRRVIVHTPDASGAVAAAPGICIAPWATLLRAVIGGVVAKWRRAPSDVDEDGGAMEVLIVVPAETSVADVVECITTPTANELRRTTFSRFVRAYQERFAVAAAAPPIDAIDVESDDDEALVLSAACRSCGLSVHDAILSLDANALETSISQSLAESPEDGVEVVGSSETDAVLLADDDVLFPAARAVSMSCDEAIVECRTGFTARVTPASRIEVSTLLRMQPRAVVLLNVGADASRAAELYSMLRRVLSQPSRPALTGAGQLLVRRVVVDFPTVFDPSEQQKYAERDAVARLGTLRSTMVSQMHASVATRRLVEDEVRIFAASRRRSFLAPRPGLSAAEAPLIIFDLRELRADLPAHLFAEGMRIVPVQLLRGDYVLSNDCAVERKSLPDLCQSLNSGRLLSQARALEQQYKLPVLLVEFAHGKPFRLRYQTQWQDSSDTSGVIPKLVRALLTCRKFVVVWARTPHHAATTMAAMKRSVAVENPDASDPALTVAEERTQRMEAGRATEMLSRLPGINARNMQNVMDVAGSLAGVGGLSLAELQEAMGDAAGQQLHSFLHTPHIGRAPRV